MYSYRYFLNFVNIHVSQGLTNIVTPLSPAVSQYLRPAASLKLAVWISCFILYTHICLYKTYRVLFP